ncbi:MAG: diguanylate cyclase, partial [Candidatus Aminicenantes bacterium]|nr:diguanylate cyclase [Candidatus Aminicenantes bacterium]
PASEQLPVLNRIAEIHLKAKAFPDAVRWAERALSSAVPRRDAWETARARLTLGAASYWLGDHARSLDLLQACRTALEALAREPGHVTPDKILKARIDAASWLGYAYQQNQDDQGHLDALLAGLELARAAGDERAKANFLYRLAIARHLRSEYEKALALGIEAIEAARTAGDPGLLVESEYAVGYIYRDLKRYDTARDFFASALRGAEARRDNLKKAMALNELGNIHLFQGRYREALELKTKALDAALLSKDDYTIASCLHDIGEVHMQRGEKAAALSYFQRALEIDLKRGDAREVAISSRNIAAIFLGLNRLRDAQQTLERALPFVEEVDRPAEQAAIYRLLADTHERRNDPAQALSYLRRASELGERILREEGSRRLQDLQTRYETEKKQKDNEALAQENRIKELALTRQTAVRHSLVALTVLLVLVVVLVFNRYRLKVRAHRELERAHDQITAQKDALDQANIRLEELSRQDPLTGLSNRRGLEEKLEEERIRFGRTGRPFALLMADLDDFKAINDTCGHDCGDYVLKTVAGVLTASLRKLTWIGRWGGDEFLLVLPETNLAGARRVADKIRERLARTPFFWEERRLDVGLSLGVGLFREGVEVEDVLREADQDMYLKKRAHKARAAAALS